MALGKDEPEKVEDLVKPNLDAIKEKVIVVALIDRDFDRAHSLPQAGPYLEAFSKAVFLSFRSNATANLCAFFAPIPLMPIKLNMP